MKMKRFVPPDLCTSEKLRLLTQNSLLGQMPLGDLESLTGLAHFLAVPAQANIFCKGDAATSMYLVARGRACVSVTSAEGKEIVLNIFDQGDIFGEVGILDGKPRTADASAMGPTSLLVFDQRNLIPFLEANPKACIRLMALLCDRVRRTTEQLEDNAFLGLRQRLAKLIIRLAAAYGRPCAKGTRIEIRLTQRELAAMLNAEREYVNRHIVSLERDGIIAQEGGSIIVCCSSSLAAIAADV